MMLWEPIPATILELTSETGCQDVQSEPHWNPALLGLPTTVGVDCESPPRRLMLSRDTATTSPNCRERP